jgi:hypothetical protein
VVLGQFGLGTVGAVIAWGLAAVFGVLALLLGRRAGLTPQTIAAAAFCSLFLSATLFLHYLAVIIPLIVFAWPLASRRRRTLVVTYVLVGIAVWFGALDSPGFRLVLLTLLVTLGAELCLIPWPTPPGSTDIAPDAAAATIPAS